MNLLSTIRSLLKRSAARPARDIGWMLPRTWGRGTIPHVGDLTALLGAYRDWFYVAAYKNATGVASVPLRLYVARTVRNQRTFPWVRTRAVSGERLKALQRNATVTKWMRKAVEIQEIEEHPALELLHSVNPDMNGFDLMEATGVYLELTGLAYWYLAYNALGYPVQIWPVRPDKMHVKTDGRWISGYEYRVGGAQTPIQFKPWEIIRFRYFNPTDPINGFGPAMAAVNPYNQLIHMDQLENEIWLKGVMGQTAFTTEQDLDDISHDRMSQQLQQTYGGSAGINVGLFEKGMKPVTFGTKPNEIGFDTQHKIKMMRTAGAFGIPMSKLTTEDVNLANAEVGEMQWHRDTIAPKLRQRESVLNEHYVPLWDEDMFLAYDDNVPDDKAHRLNEIKTRLAGAPMTTQDEERAIDGLSPMGGTASELPERGSGVSMDALQGRAGRTNGEKGVSAYPQGKRLSREARREHWKAFDRATRAEESQFKGILADLWDKQVKEVIANIRKAGKRDLKAIKADPEKVDSWLFDPTKWQARFFDEGKTLIQAVVKKHGDMAADEIPMEFAFDVTNPDTAKFITDKTFRFSFEVNKTSRDALREVLIDSVNEGLSIPQIAKEVETWYGDMAKYRAVRIARTEVVGAANGGAMQSYEQSGVVAGTEWIATMDSRVRDTHAALDGEQVAIGGMFSNGCRFPGDPGGPVGEVVNCRCAQAAVLKGEM